MRKFFQGGEHRVDELFEVRQVMLQDLPDPSGIHVLVTMDQNIAEPRHRRQSFGQFGGDHPFAL